MSAPPTATNGTSRRRGRSNLTAAPPSPGPPHRGPSVAVGDGVTAGTVGAVAETASPGRARS